MGINGRRRAQQRFSREVMAGSILRLYMAVASRQPGGIPRLQEEPEP